MATDTTALVEAASVDTEVEDTSSAKGEFVVTVEGAKTSLEVLQRLAKETNIATLLTESQRNKLGGVVLTDYNTDYTDRKPREERMEAAMKLAMQVAEPKTFPWDGAANVKFPLLTKAAIDFAARAYPAIVQDGRIAKGVVIGSDEGVQKINPETGEFEFEVDETGQPVVGEDGQPLPKMIGRGRKRAQADRVANYINYQIMEEMDCWEDDTDRLLNSVAVCGSIFRKEFYNPLKGCVDSYIIYPKHFVMPYYARSVETSPRCSELIEIVPNQLRERERAGLFIEIDYAVSNETLEDKARDQTAPSSADDQAPHIFIEQHRWVDLDGDGYAEPYIVTVHKQSSQVVRILARYDDFTVGDPVNEQIKLNEGQVLVDNEGNIARICAENYYTKYGFIPSPDGSIYDLGFGDLLMPLNDSINTLINQLLDAGTLNNTSTGFIGKGLRMKGGAVRIKPGEWPRVESMGGSIRDNIVPITHPAPSTALFQLLGTLIEAGKELGIIKDALTGEAAVNQAATTTMAMIEQGLKAFQSIFKRTHRSIKKELKRIYFLNAKYLPQDAYYTTMGEAGAVAQEDFSRTDVAVIPISDPEVSTDMQKMAQANFLLSLANDPNVDRVEALRRTFEAMRIPDIDKLLVDRPPQPSPEVIKALTDQIRKEVTDETEQARIKLEDDRKRQEILAKKDIEGEKLLMEEKLTLAKIAADMIKNMSNNTVVADDTQAISAQNKVIELAVKSLTDSSAAIHGAVKEMVKPRRTSFIRDQEGRPTGTESVVIS